MKVTRIEKQKYNEERYNIYIDGNFNFSASAENILKYSINEGKNFSKDEIENIIRDCEESKAYSYALKILSIKDYTMKEILSKLRSKNYSDQTISSIIEKLTDYNLINDSEYAKKYINNGYNIKKIGKNKIVYELGRRGVDTKGIDWNALDDGIQFENAYDLALKKYRTLDDKATKREKIARHLMSKGYEYELIKKVLNRVFKEEYLDD